MPTETLRMLIERNGAVSREDAVSAMMPVLHQLLTLQNRGTPYLALSPDTVAYRGDTVLLKRVSDTPKVRASGFAPPELYGGKNAGSLSDIYSCCALLRYMTTGTPPLDAMERVKSSTSFVADDAFDEIIEHGMLLNAESRYSSIDELIYLLQPFSSGNPPSVIFSKGNATDPQPARQTAADDGAAAVTTDAAPATAAEATETVPVTATETAETRTAVNGSPAESGAKPKKKRRGPHPAIIALISFVVVIGLAVGAYFFTYYTASSAADEGDFAKADKYLLLTNVTRLHDSALVDYVEAGLLLQSNQYEDALHAFEAIGSYRDSEAYANSARYEIAADFADDGRYEDALAQYEILANYGYDDAEEQALEMRYQIAAKQLADGDTDAAIASYEYLAEHDYKDSQERWLDTRYTKALYLLEDLGDYDAALDAFTSLANEGYEGAEEMCHEVVYREATDYFNNDDYIMAYELYTLIPGYKDADEQAESLTGAFYAIAQSYYQNADYSSAKTLFEYVSPYDRSADYLTLIAAHEQTLDAATAVTALLDLFSFEDAASLILSNQKYAETFLTGYWIDYDNVYHLYWSASEIDYNLPYIEGGDYFYIENGYMKIYNEGEPELAWDRFYMVPLSATCIGVTCYADGSYIVLYKQL